MATYKIQPNEYWYGLCVNEGTKFPLSETSTFSWHAADRFSGNQEAPLLLSSKGRFFWSERPYNVDVADGVITAERM